MKEFIENIFDKGGADLILFPELANTGYVQLLDQDFGREFLKCAEPIAESDGETLAYADREGEEEVLFTEFSNDHLLEMRAVSPVFRDRRPKLYGFLSEPF